MKKTLTKSEKTYGLFFGSILGDALGVPYEFSEPSEINYTHSLKGGGPFNLKAGEWTDDTSMMLCLSDSLIQNKGHNPQMEMSLYSKWIRTGLYSSTGECFDVGDQTFQTVATYARLSHTEKDVYTCAQKTEASGNGALMRLSPIPIIASSIVEAIELSTNVSLTTHNNDDSLNACTGYSLLLWIVLNKNLDKETLLTCPIFENLSYGDCRGYSWDSYQLALEAFKVTNSFEECMTYVISKGGDTDTNACIAGMLAGAFYGVEDQKHLIQQLAKLDLLTDMYEKLINLQQTNIDNYFQDLKEGKHISSEETWKASQEQCSKNPLKYS